jgi:hypothetical protein
LVSSVVVKRPLEVSNRLLRRRIGLLINPILESMDITSRRLRIAFREGILNSIRSSFPNGRIRDVFRMSSSSEWTTLSVVNANSALNQNAPYFAVNRFGQNVNR